MCEVINLSEIKDDAAEENDFLNTIDSLIKIASNTPIQYFNLS
jgi:hypothetical protein